MNWAKRLLTAGDCPESEEHKYSIPACNCPLHGGAGDGTVHCDDCEYPHDGVCDYPGDDNDEDDPPQYCDQCGDVIPDGETWCLDVRDGTEHFCSAECQHERAAEIEAAPLCIWCLEKCDQGVVRIPGNPAPFCSTYCAEQWSMGRKP